jgi:hypothetical protein
VQGILGLNALTSFNFTLSPPDGRMDANAERPNGEVVPFTTVEGRIAVKASMGKEVLTMILDSGSNHVVLFRLPNAMARISSVPTTMRTIEGARSVVPTRWTAELSVTEHVRFQTLPAVVLDTSKRQADGLLPASVFKTIYVDQARHELVLVR